MNKVLAKEEWRSGGIDADVASASGEDTDKILNAVERSFFDDAARDFCDDKADAFLVAARDVVERLAPDPKFRAAFSAFMRLFPDVPFDPE